MRLVMGKSLTEIAKELMKTSKKVQLIYAFNGVGKTRLSEEFKQLVYQQETHEDDDDFATTDSCNGVLYYNAFTEDLFYWDNDLENGVNRKIKIQPNNFTPLILEEEGKEFYIAKLLSRYTHSKLTPNFSSNFTEVTFSIPGKDPECENIKISKSEESSFIWCIFYSILEYVIEQLNEEKDNRSTDKFNQIKYIFIDDPVTSLDENHLIELAVDLAKLIKESKSNLKFIITTHNSLFFNVLFSEFKNHVQWLLVKLDDGTYKLSRQNNDGPFSYHLHLLVELRQAIEFKNLHKYHFNLLRNVLEKTAVFLGYDNWKELIDGPDKDVINRLIDNSSHSHYSDIEMEMLSKEQADTLSRLFSTVIDKFKFRLPQNCNKDNQFDENHG